MRKIGDIVIDVMKKHDMNDIDIGCNSMFQDIYDSIVRKPNYYFEKWKSNVLQALLRDKRFYRKGTMAGLRNNPTLLVGLKEEYISSHSEE